MFGDIKLEMWNNLVGRFRSKLQYRRGWSSSPWNSFESIAWNKNWGISIWYVADKAVLTLPSVPVDFINIRQYWVRSLAQHMRRHTVAGRIVMKLSCNCVCYKWNCHYWSTWWPVAWSEPSHHINQCCLVVDWPIFQQVISRKLPQKNRPSLVHISHWLGLDIKDPRDFPVAQRNNNVENAWNHQRTIICIQNHLLFCLNGWSLAWISSLPMGLPPSYLFWWQLMWWVTPDVAVSVRGRSGLWPFRSVAVSVCGRFGLWPFRFVAVSVCGLSGLWPFRFVAVSVCGLSVVAVSVCGRYDLLPWQQYMWHWLFDHVRPCHEGQWHL